MSYEPTARAIAVGHPHAAHRARRRPAAAVGRPVPHRRARLAPPAPPGARTTRSPACPTAPSCTSDGAKALARAGATARSPRCCSSTSTASRRSTTRSATTAATRCCVEVAARLRAAAARAATSLARLGGDEFAVLLADAADRGAVARGRRAPARARSARPFDVARRRASSVGASVGIALLPRPRRATSTTLLRHADVAMYEAKRARTGASRSTRRARPLLAASASSCSASCAARSTTTSSSCTSSPRSTSAAARVIGVEALVRWQHPERGLLGPHEFLAARRAHGPDRATSRAGCSTPPCASAPPGGAAGLVSVHGAVLLLLSVALWLVEASVYLVVGDVVGVSVGPDGGSVSIGGETVGSVDADGNVAVNVGDTSVAVGARRRQRAERRRRRQRGPRRRQRQRGRRRRRIGGCGRQRGRASRRHERRCQR